MSEWLLVRGWIAGLCGVASEINELSIKCDRDWEA